MPDGVHLVPNPEPDDAFAEDLRKWISIRATLDAEIERRIVAVVDDGGRLAELDKDLRKAIAASYAEGRWPDVYEHLVGVVRNREAHDDAIERNKWAEIEVLLEGGASSQARSMAEDITLPPYVQRRLLKWVEQWQSVVAEIDVGGSIASTEIMLRKQHVKALGKTNESVLNGWLHVAAKRIERNTIMTREAQATIAIAIDTGATVERVLDEVRTKAMPLDVRDTVVAWARAYAARRPQAIE